MSEGLGRVSEREEGVERMGEAGYAKATPAARGKERVASKPT